MGRWNYHWQHLQAHGHLYFGLEDIVHFSLCHMWDHGWVLDPVLLGFGDWLWAPGLGPIRDIILHATPGGS